MGKESFSVASHLVFKMESLSLSLEALYQNTYAVDRLSLFGRRTDRARYSVSINADPLVDYVLLN